MKAVSSWLHCQRLLPYRSSHGAWSSLIAARRKRSPRKCKSFVELFVLFKDLAASAFGFSVEGDGFLLLHWCLRVWWCPSPVRWHYSTSNRNFGCNRNWLLHRLDCLVTKTDRLWTLYRKRPTFDSPTISHSTYNRHVSIVVRLHATNPFVWHWRCNDVDTSTFRWRERETARQSTVKGTEERHRQERSWLTEMMFGCETWRGGWFGLIWGERRLIRAKKGAR